MSSTVLLSSFTPSTMSPEVLEAIFVKREPLAERIVDSLTAALVDGDIEHHLAIGPRGMGKTHLLTIVVNRLRHSGLGHALAIAWLREEEWGVTTVGELYEQVLHQLAADPTSDRSLADAARSAADDLLSVDPENLAAAAEGHLTELLAGRRLVVVVENLDQIFDSIGADDQHQLRAYLQTQRNIVLLASSPTLSPSIATREGLFFGFFAIHHLDELTVEEARDLLLRIAELHDDEESRRLREYLPTGEATNRLEVVARIAGGHPRLWVLMSECITTERLDEIVTLLHAVLDDLTPYYQAQMASLSGQQRKVVTALARTTGALLVKDIAARTRMAPNAAAKHIGDLVKLGFVRPAVLPDGVELADRRSKAYELREPLLRHSLELKESRGEPLHLIVAFLRAWFDTLRLERWAQDANATVALYAQAALVRHAQETSDVGRVTPGFDALNRDDLVVAEHHATALTISMPGSPYGPLLSALVLLKRNEYAEALMQFQRAADNSDSGSDLLQEIYQGIALCLAQLERHAELMEVTERPVLIDDPQALLLRTASLVRRGEVLEAPALLRRVAELAPESAHLHTSSAVLFKALGLHDEAISALEHAHHLAPGDVHVYASLTVARARREGAGPIRDDFLVIVHGLERAPDALMDFLAELVQLALQTISADQRHEIVGLLLDLDEIAPTLHSSLVGMTLGALASSEFLHLEHAERDEWFEQIETLARRQPELESIVFPWTRAIRRYTETHDGAELLALPAEVRALMTGLGDDAA
jgi:tetratricopeptide (TPR) repeat protein